MPKNYKLVKNNQSIKIFYNSKYEEACGTSNCFDIRILYGNVVSIMINLILSRESSAHDLYVITLQWSTFALSHFSYLTSNDMTPVSGIVTTIESSLVKMFWTSSGTENVGIDGDDPRHIQWIFEKAQDRADQFNIKGMTYRLTQGEFAAFNLFITPKPLHVWGLSSCKKGPFSDIWKWLLFDILCNFTL